MLLLFVEGFVENRFVQRRKVAKQLTAYAERIAASSR